VPSRRRRACTALELCTPWAILVLAGCGGGRGAAYRDVEADELRFQNTRREEELRKAEEAIRILKAQAGALALEKDSLQGQLADLKSQVRAQRQGMDQLEADRGAAEERVRQAVERQDELKRNLERAASLLGLVAEEVASLRREWRGIEAAARAPRRHAEDLDFIEKNALLSAKIEQLHFELLRERALLGGFSRARSSPPAPGAATPSPTPGDAEAAARPESSAQPWPPQNTARVPRPMTEPKESPPEDEGAQDAQAGGQGFWARAGGAVASAWRWLPLERAARALQVALLVACGAALLGLMAILGVKLIKRLRAGLPRRRAPATEPAEDAPREEPVVEDEPIDPTALIEPSDPEEKTGEGAEEKALAIPEPEPAAVEPPPGAGAQQAGETTVLAESADFFEAFGGRRARKPRDPGPPGREPVRAEETTTAQESPRPRDAVQPAGAGKPAAREVESAAAGPEPEATQALDPEPAEPSPGEASFTQVIPDAEGKEWSLTEEIPGQGQDDFKRTQVMPGQSGEDFLSTQVIPPIPEVESERLREPFSAQRETAEDTPTQVIKEPEALKGPGWPGQKSAPPRRQSPGKGPAARPPAARAEKRGPPRKGPPSDKDLLAELEELIGRKIDEPTR
jgi:hypothetical protein